MKKRNTQLNRGQLLREAVEATRRNKQEVALKAGYTRSSYYKHIQEPDLPYHIMAAYGRAIGHDFTEELPEMPRYIIDEPDESYTTNLNTEELIRQRDYWKDKYIDLLEKYNRMIEERSGKR